MRIRIGDRSRIGPYQRKRFASTQMPRALGEKKFSRFSRSFYDQPRCACSSTRLEHGPYETGPLLTINLSINNRKFKFHVYVVSFPRTRLAFLSLPISHSFQERLSLPWKRIFETIFLLLAVHVSFPGNASTLSPLVRYPPRVFDN